MTFGQKLKHIRKEVLHLTQQELAESLNFTQATINSIETGKNKEGSFELFRKLVMVHHVNPMYFIFDETTEPAILKREGKLMKPYLQKIAKYERLVGELTRVKNGK